MDVKDSCVVGSGESLSLAPQIARYVIEKLRERENAEGEFALDLGVDEAALTLPADPKVLADCRRWLATAAQRARQVSVATHPAKFCHPDSKAVNLMDPAIGLAAADSPYVCTAALKRLSLDWAGNAAALDVVKLLSIEGQGKSLLHRLEDGILVDLLPFAESPEQAEAWCAGFLTVRKAARPHTHTFSKQVYFPVCIAQQSMQYHLLFPRTSSSLAHAVAQRIEHSRFSEVARTAREAKKKGVWSDEKVTQFPEVAVQKFGGTKPQNISLLNSKRKGAIYLLRSVPPEWRAQDGASLKKSGDLWRHLFWQANRPIHELKEWIYSERENNMAARAERGQLVKSILDLFIQNILEIRNYHAQRGLGVPATLSPIERIALDPTSQAPDLLVLLSSGDWRSLFAEEFARQLLSRLKKPRDQSVLFADEHLRKLKQDAREELTWLDDGDE